MYNHGVDNQGNVTLLSLEELASSNNIDNIKDAVALLKMQCHKHLITDIQWYDHCNKLITTSAGYSNNAKI